jgi:hypothetical protein
VVLVASRDQKDCLPIYPIESREKKGEVPTTLSSVNHTTGQKRNTMHGIRDKVVAVASQLIENQMLTTFKILFLLSNIPFCLGV